jgi:hypothetical protein
MTAGFAIDITDRKQAEDKLRRSEASLARRSRSATPAAGA